MVVDDSTSVTRGVGGGLMRGPMTDSRRPIQARIRRKLRNGQHESKIQGLGGTRSELRDGNREAKHSARVTPPLPTCFLNPTFETSSDISTVSSRHCL